MNVQVYIYIYIYIYIYQYRSGKQTSDYMSLSLSLYVYRWIYTHNALESASILLGSVSSYYFVCIGCHRNSHMRDQSEDTYIYIYISNVAACAECDAVLCGGVLRFIVNSTVPKASHSQQSTATVFLKPSKEHMSKVFVIGDACPRHEAGTSQQKICTRLDFNAIRTQPNSSWRWWGWLVGADKTWNSGSDCD